MSERRKPKFRVGQRVAEKDADCIYTIIAKVLDPSDGWLYYIGDHMGTLRVMRLESDLTAREARR
jgi:hypothetical protein